jgi:hypothetical protein
MTQTILEKWKIEEVSRGVLQSGNKNKKMKLLLVLRTVIRWQYGNNDDFDNECLSSEQTVNSTVTNCI